MAAKKKTATDASKTGSPSTIRNEAEKKLKELPDIPSEFEGQNQKRLIYELRVHQIELEIQAEELKKSKLALEVSRDNFLDLYDFAPTGIFTVSEKGLIVEVNLTGSTLLGVERSRLIKTQFSKYIVEKDVEVWHWYFINVLNQDEKKSCTLMLKRAGGSAFPARLDGVRLSGGINHDIRIAISDITDIRLAEVALKESERFLTNIVEQIPDMIFVKDARDLRFVQLNKAGENLLGYSRAEMLGKNDYDFFPKEEADFFTGNDREVLLTNQLSDNPAEKIQTRFKGERILHTKKIPIVDEKGVPRYLLGISEDITERKKGEDALRETKDYLENLIRYANVPIVSWNPELMITEFNRAFTHLSGMTREEVIGQPLDIIFPETTRKKSMALIRRALMGRHLQVVEIPVRHISGGTRIVLWNSTNILDTMGKIIATIAQGQDITERKTADEIIKKYGENIERQLTERTSDLSDVNLKLMTEIEIRIDAEKQLTKSVGEKEVLLREVHHRVKNNLQIIISLLNLQSRYITDETTLAAFRESQNRVRVMALVHEKLYQSADITKLDLGNYIQFLGNNLLQFFDIKGKGITLTIDIHDIFLAIDTVIPLGLIINELISNSLKYAFPEGMKGEIALAVQRQDHTLTMLFKDNGVGIPEDFDWRNAKSLGLRLVVSLVDQLDGTIERDRSSGTMFTIVVKEKV
jgi:PAS domain S-box-containing protein